MAWIESHQQIERHPKTLKLMELMDWSLNETVGALHRFWWWCIDFAEDGDLQKFTDTQLGCAVGIYGDQAKGFVGAMLEACWLDRVPYFRVHDWWDYAGRFLQVKYKAVPEKWQVVRAKYVEGRLPHGQSNDDAVNNNRSYNPNHEGEAYRKVEGGNSYGQEKNDAANTLDDKDNKINTFKNNGCNNHPNNGCNNHIPNLTIPNQTKPKKEKQEKKSLKADACHILEFLNLKAKKNFEPVDTHLKLISARLEEGATVQKCKSIIAMKCRKWSGDPKTEEWLRPKTLFNKTNFDNYKGELVVSDE